MDTTQNRARRADRRLTVRGALMVGFLWAVAAGCCGGSPSVAVPTNFTVTELKKTDGELGVLLKAEVAKAREAGRTPYAELTAEWCGPCKALRASLGDPRMSDAFDGTYIIQLDYDAWGKDLAGAGLAADAIPVFFELDEDGKPTGRRIDGGAWGENIPANMAPPLKEFFTAGQRGSP